MDIELSTVDLDAMDLFIAENCQVAEFNFCGIREPAVVTPVEFSGLAKQLQVEVEVEPARSKKV